MTGTSHRPYEALSDRYDALVRDGWTGGVVGQVDGYPFYELRKLPVGPASQHWLLAAGIHGDEPAGHLGLLEFLEQEGPQLPEDLEMTVLPCINPWGYEHDQREDRQGVDLNREFEGDRTGVVNLCKRLLEDQVFHLFLDFHEDWEFDGYYLFEVRQETDPRIGPALIDAVRPHGRIYNRPEVDGLPVVDGVVDATPSILADHDIGQQPLPLWLFHTGRTHRSITSETPSRAWSETVRIATHVEVARACLRHLLP